ncbi:hypothetical protein FSP39_013622 [Pinctada imbricata]|uniref:Pathogen-related protein n=1 Tax=Pinctada imbricata TaxID=66713 RepID=A0AA88Y2H7_PINIB|nr:hypothetical protein FSP39_013622 [Pinctada imbricata]
MDEKDIKWRNGLPNYDIVNKTFQKERTKKHSEGSLESIVENLVKTWEMESTHKERLQDWKSVTQDFAFQVNGGPKFNAKDNVDRGNYNMLLEGSPLYDVCKESNASSHEMFKKAFPEGFAWELLEVFSGPPRVSFTWRHWAKWSRDFNGVKATGETLELFGSCVVEVDSDLKIKFIHVFYDPSIMMATLTGFGCKHLGKDQSPEKETKSVKVSPVVMN